MSFPLAALAGMAGGGASSGGAGAAAGALTGLASAATSLAGPFNAIVDMATKFVSAIDPSIVAELNRAFRDLNAVIGGALRPILYVAVDVVRNLIGSLGPVMQQLEPIINKIANAMGNVLITLIENLAAILTNLMPLLDFVVDVVVGLVNVFGVFLRAMRPVIEVVMELGKQLLHFIAGLFGFDPDEKDAAKDAMKSLVKAFQDLIKNVILAVATFMKMMGMDKTLAALIKGLQPAVKGAKAGQAVQDSAFKQIGDLGSEVYKSAFIATGGGGAAREKPEDFLKGILAKVEDIAAGKTSKLPETAQKILDAIIAANELALEVKQAVIDVYNKLPNAPPIFEARAELQKEQERAKGLDIQIAANQKRLREKGPIP